MFIISSHYLCLHPQTTIGITYNMSTLDEDQCPTQYSMETYDSEQLMLDAGAEMTHWGAVSVVYTLFGSIFLLSLMVWVLLVPTYFYWYSVVSFGMYFEITFGCCVENFFSTSQLRTVIFILHFLYETHRCLQHHHRSRCLLGISRFDRKGPGMDCFFVLLYFDLNIISGISYSSFIFLCTCVFASRNVPWEL